MHTAKTGVLYDLGTGVHRLGRLVRFSHTIFALPFAAAGVLYAAHNKGAWPPLSTWFWVLAAMAGARTAAMAFNRLADSRIDAANPRTRDREIPSGKVSLFQAGAITAAGAALLVLASWRLNPLCLKLSPLALFVILFYSYTKCFTWSSHFVLGLGLGVAPLGGWLAVTGAWNWGIAALSAAVLCWIAGLDILYALQDEAFDREHGLHSVPQHFGKAVALRLSLACHVSCVLALALVGTSMGVSPWYWLGLGFCAGILVVEQTVVRSKHPRRIQIAFFDMNGLFSLAHLAAVLMGVFL